MRVIVNGREMSERIDSLERKEQTNFETISIIKTISYIVGAIAIICSFDLFDGFIVLGNSINAFWLDGSTAIGS